MLLDLHSLTLKLLINAKKNCPNKALSDNNCLGGPSYRRGWKCKLLIPPGPTYQTAGSILVSTLPGVGTCLV